MSQTNRTPVCVDCPARCCTRGRWVFDFLCLTDKEAALPRFKQHVKIQKDPMSNIQDLVISLDPKCPFLKGDNKCGIYNHRPRACREYVCHKHAASMVRINQYPTHKKLLRKWKVAPGQANGWPNNQ